VQISHHDFCVFVGPFLALSEDFKKKSEFKEQARQQETTEEFETFKKESEATQGLSTQLNTGR